MKRRVLALLALLDARPAHASEWRYCLAFDRAGETVYVTEPFRSAELPDALDAAFGRSLDGLTARHDVVQCPRARSENDILSLRIVGSRFNLQEGRRIVDLSWRPDERGPDRSP